ncbi:TupA-like ATPgrasp [Selenomonas sp. WCT3]|uniref:ATP-grasp fold amidoligase family protein n=1 Tax=Selenomonas sp. WCT3 TaxID=3158785 RepID=UPI0008909602|nr:TupA-like ATPgrasp [Selenomonas ruminantium]
MLIGDGYILIIRIAEPQSDLTDYKLMCFNGKVECSFTCTNRNTEAGLHVTFYDRDWQKMPFARHYPAEQAAMPKPRNYEKMVQLAEKLAAPLKFARVDFYEINGRIYFGEITFFPGNGTEEFSPEKWDYRLGEWIELKTILIAK